MGAKTLPADMLPVAAYAGAPIAAASRCEWSMGVAVFAPRPWGDAVNRIPKNEMCSRWSHLAAAVLVLLLPFHVAQAAHYRVLHNFAKAPDGSVPLGGVYQDASGNLYGATSEGGTSSCYGGSLGCGVIYKLAPDGNQTIPHRFNDTGDASNPWDPPIVDSAGNFFGTAPVGGAYVGGAVYELSPDGTESVLYSFRPYTGDGYEPVARLIRDSAGNFYGTATYGGANTYGAVFKLAPDGTETILHSFADTDGEHPFDYGGLVADEHGNLYGTAMQGGDLTLCKSYNGCGTVWKLKPNGKLDVLYAFKAGSDGLWPLAGLIVDQSGNLYGTTESGGSYTNCTNVGCGTVFKLASDGTETVLYAFAGEKDGAQPFAPLLFDSSGNLYGSTNCFDDRHSCYFGLGCEGGPACGTIFRIAPDDTESVLHVFTGGSDGGGPAGALIFGANGRLYGTASEGGSHSGGTVFSLEK